MVSPDLRRPVLITACTTTMGIIPLVNDNLFSPMAVTIMGGFSLPPF